MNLDELRVNWDLFGRTNPMWAILTSNTEWKSEEFFATGVDEIRYLMSDCESLGRPTSRSRALDFGCGIGRLTQALAFYFDQVDGVDISPSMIERANYLSAPNCRCRFHLNVREDLRLFADESFDLIYSNITLQHMEPRYIKKYLAEFMRLVVPGGLVVFQLPSELIERSQIKDIAWRIAPGWSKTGYKKFKRMMLFAFRNDPRLETAYSPIMEMHGIRKSQLLKFIDALRGQTLKVSVDTLATSPVTWRSYIYFVTKLN